MIILQNRNMFVCILAFTILCMSLVAEGLSGPSVVRGPGPWPSRPPPKYGPAMTHNGKDKWKYSEL